MFVNFIVYIDLGIPASFLRLAGVLFSAEGADLLRGREGEFPTNRS